MDYWSGSSNLTLAVNMVKLRYANYPKDYFMGMLPSSQYGSVALLPSIHPSTSPSALFVSSDSRVLDSSQIRNPNGGSSLDVTLSLLVLLVPETVLSCV